MPSNGLLFYQYSIFDVIERQNKELRAKVQLLPSNAMLSRPIDDLVGELVDALTMAVPKLDLENAHVSQSEGMVDVYDPFGGDDYGFGGRGNKRRVMGTIVSLVIPFDGEAEFFEVRPQSSDMNPPRALVANREVRITVSGGQLTSEQVKQELDRTRDSLLKYLGWLSASVDPFNNSLEQNVRATLNTRKAKLLEDQNLVSNLGYALTKRPNAPKTYAAPVIRKKIATTATPSAVAKPFKPEPALDDATYRDILNLMQNMTMVMERSPTAFASMGEEDLRQHFLVQLNGQYEGSASGETFNYQGKTDILIRVDGKNIFIAECKFWGGPKAFLETIDQLLGYVSWRDTKVAVVIFNRNKDFSKVIEAILQAVEQHPNKKSGPAKENETQFRYKFSNPSDADRELILTVMAFDVPKQ